MQAVPSLSDMAEVAGRLTCNWHELGSKMGLRKEWLDQIAVTYEQDERKIEVLCRGLNSECFSTSLDLYKFIMRIGQRAAAEYLTHKMRHPQGHH